MVCEVASSAALLIGAGLLIRSLVRLQEVNPGFRTDHVLTMQLSLPPARYPGLKVGLFYEQLLRRVAGLPGVQTAGVCRFLPLSGSDASAEFPDRRTAAPERRGSAARQLSNGQRRVLCGAGHSFAPRPAL